MWENFILDGEHRVCRDCNLVYLVSAMAHVHVLAHVDANVVRRRRGREHPNVAPRSQGHPDCDKMTVPAADADVIRLLFQSDSTSADSSGQTIVASDSMMCDGVSGDSFPQVIFSLGGAALYPP